MDNRREALLEKAKELGSLAQQWPLGTFLDNTPIYRTLARCLEVEAQWWGEFWHSLFYTAAKGVVKISSIRMCCKSNILTACLEFMCLWFGRDRKLSDLTEEEFGFVSRIFLKYKSRKKTA